MTDDPPVVAGAEAPAAETQVTHDQIIDLDAVAGADDAPAAKPQDEVKPEGTETEAPESTEDVGDGSEDDEGEETAAPKKRSGLTRLKAQLAAAQAQIEALNRIAPKQTDETALQGLLEKRIGDPPKESDFTDYLEFQTAKIAYEVRKGMVKEEIQRDTARAAETQALAQAEIVETFKERAKTVRKTIKDFDEVTKAATVSPTHPDVIHAILTSDKGPQLAYYLSKNPETVNRINAMPPFAAAREIGKLEASLSSATPKTVTKAPAPIEPVIGGTARPVKDPDSMSMTEYKAWRANGGGR